MIELSFSQEDGLYQLVKFTICNAGVDDCIFKNIHLKLTRPHWFTDRRFIF